MFGLAARTKFLRIETLAHNRRSALHPDRTGKVATSLRITPGAPASLKSRAAFTRLLGAARGTAIDARLSRDAGRYICNYVYWRALEVTDNSPAVVVFVHVPKLRSRNRKKHGPRLPTLPQLIRAGSAVILAANAAVLRH